MKVLKKQRIMTLLKSLSILIFCTMSCIAFSQNNFDYKNTIKSPLLRSFEIKADSISTLDLLANEKMKTQNYNSFYQAHLGAFCKLENNVLKSANIPVRMRLGSTEYVDELEQKTPAYRTIDK